jgi:hypothetical protein
MQYVNSPYRPTLFVLAWFIMSLVLLSPARGHAQSVSGEAFGLFVDAPGMVADIPPTPHVILPPGGGMETDMVAMSGAPGVVSTGAITVSTQGTITATDATAESFAETSDLDIVGVLSADSVTAMCMSMGDGTTATSNADGSGFSNLIVAGMPQAANPPPNTVILIPGGTVILNEQVTGGDGVTTSEITVNMIHVTLTPLVGEPTEIIVSSAHCDVNFALVPPPDDDFCAKGPVQQVLDPVGGRFPANTGLDSLVRVELGESVQTAIDTATDTNGDGYIIIGVRKNDTTELGGETTESIVIDDIYAQPFALIGCSVTLHDANLGDGLPTAHITPTASSPDLFVMDLHAADSEAQGWLVEGDGRYLRNVRAVNNSTGIQFSGNNNTLHNGPGITDNINFGILVTGAGNLIMDAQVDDNFNVGIQVSGNNNTLFKNSVGERNVGNLGDGIVILSQGNEIVENDVFANSGNGIDVQQGSNLVRKNDVGERNKGNFGQGIQVAGQNIRLEENRVKANGLSGFEINGTNHLLKANTSGGTGSGEDNGGCEYNVATATNNNGGNNKANGTTVAGNPFPAGCTGTP